MCEKCETEPRRLGAASSRCRLKLWEINPNYHCAILGTCLTMDELRKVLRQSGMTLRQGASDYDLHAVLVTQAEHNGRPAKYLQRMLDGKYRRWIQAIAKSKSREEMHQLWQAALASGDIGGPFWAIMSQTQADSELLRLTYEDVHMLSHIQGASNRADLQQLKYLKTALSDLKQSLERSQAQHRQQLRQRDELIQAQAQRLAKPDSFQPDQIKTAATSRIAELERQYQALRRRLDWTEGQLAQRDIQLAQLQEERLGLKELLAESSAERQALEQSMNKLMAETLSDDQPQEEGIDLEGKRILYVGGKASLAPRLRSLVEANNGQFRHHDGGLEESRAGLQCALTGSDMVFCPVDCISHDACLRAKQYCRQQNKQFIPLRSSGLSAFAAGLRRHAGRYRDRQPSQNRA